MGKIFLLGFIVIFFISFFVQKVFLPADILLTLPSYHEYGWQSPKNSLLADPVFQFEPWRFFAKESIREFRIPLWNPLNGHGAPFFANPQTAILYPLTILYYIFPVAQSLFFIHALKIYLIFCFTYLYFRSLHFDRFIGMIGALSIAFGGFMMGWLSWPHTNVFLLFPLLLYITEKIQITKHLHRWLILISVIYALAFFGGHPETLFSISLLHVGYLLFRYWGKWKIVFQNMLFIFWGFLLASIQLIPFLEYLFYSHAIYERSTTQSPYLLPIISSIQFLFPFFLGSPHLEWYKPFTLSTNFQETVGGYIGMALFVLAILCSVRFFKEPFVKYWTILLVLLIGISYSLFPFFLLSKLPILATSANHRLIGFAGFSLVVLGSYFLQRSYRGAIFRHWYKLFIFGGSLVLVLSGSVLFIYPYLLQYLPPSWHAFGIFFLSHTAYQVLTFLLFLFATLFLSYRPDSIIRQVLVILTITLQTALLFFPYNPFVQRELYYPENELVKTLKSLPSGPLLEVGNPFLEQNSNVMYGISHAENYDALEVRWYREKFDSLFKRNKRWNKVDEISTDGLQEFGIRYIVSDYNLLDRKEPFKSHEDDDVLRQSVEYTVDFENKGNKTLTGIRFVPATFNRKNNCVFEVTIRNASKDLAKQTKDCSKLYNGMFTTIAFPQIPLTNGKYVIVFKSHNATDSQTISFFGKGNSPYVEVLYADEKRASSLSHLSLLVTRDSYYLFQNTAYQTYQFPGKVKTLRESREVVTLKTTSDVDGLLRSFMTYFPGWQATIDGQSTTIHRNGSFIALFLPRGEHVVTITYKPLSVVVGWILSALTLFVLLYFFVSSEKNASFIQRTQQSYNTFIKRANKLPLEFHFSFLALGIGIGIVASFLAMRIFPYTGGGMRETTAINWLTVNRYPKEQDTYYFFIIFFTIVTVSLVFWFFIIWRKIKK